MCRISCHDIRALALRAACRRMNRMFSRLFLTERFCYMPMIGGIRIACGAWYLNLFTVPLFRVSSFIEKEILDLELPKVRHPQKGVRYWGLGHVVSTWRLMKIK